MARPLFFTEESGMRGMHLAEALRLSVERPRRNRKLCLDTYQKYVGRHRAPARQAAFTEQHFEGHNQRGHSTVTLLPIYGAGTTILL